MSHRIIGLDIGTRSVKVIQVVSRMRTHQVVAWDEELVQPAAPDDGPAAEAEAEGGLEPGVRVALQALKQRGMLDGDVTVVGYGLEACLQSHVQLPFSQRKQIEAVLPAQVEERFPVELDELVIDFEVHERSPAPDVPREISVVATRIAELGAFLSGLREFGLDPRVVEVGPARLLAAQRLLQPGPNAAERSLLVDIGHRYTDMCLADGNRVRGMRRILFGGEQVTERIAQTLQAPLEEAERIKHYDAAVDMSVSAGAPAITHEAELRVREVCRAWAQELLEEIVRSLHGFPGSSEAPVQRVYLCGGGAALRGLAQYLATALQTPAEMLVVPQAGGPGSGMRAVGALGLAARGLADRLGSELNLRRGPFAYRGDLDFLKARTWPLAILAILAVLALVFMLVAQRSALAARRDAYRNALCQTSQAILAEEVCEPAEVMRRLGVVTGAIDLPENSAYDLFRDISAELVFLRDEVEVPVDVERLTVDIQRDIVSIRGSTESAAYVDEIVAQLSGLPCLSGVGTESTTQNRSTGMFDFVLRATNSCS